MFASIVVLCIFFLIVGLVIGLLWGAHSVRSKEVAANKTAVFAGPMPHPGTTDMRSYPPDPAVMSATEYHFQDRRKFALNYHKAVAYSMHGYFFNTYLALLMQLKSALVNGNVPSGEDAEKFLENYEKLAEVYPLIEQWESNYHNRRRKDLQYPAQHTPYQLFGKAVETIKSIAETENLRQQIEQAGKVQVST